MNNDLNTSLSRLSSQQLSMQQLSPQQLSPQQLSSQQLYAIGSILATCVEASKNITSNDAFQYAFRYNKTVDYSEKKFECSQAKAAKAFFELCHDKPEVIAFIRQLKVMLNNIDI